MTHTDRFYALSLALAGSLMIVLPMQALASYVDLSRSHAKIACGDGETANIDGSYDTVTVRGHCALIAIGGDDNVVHADRADRVTIVGSNNVVYYGGAAPQTDIRDGTGDQVVAATPANAKTSVMLPEASPSPDMLANANATPVPSSQASASVPLPAATGLATSAPLDTAIDVEAAQAVVFENSAGAQLGPPDTALNGGQASDGAITIVVGDGRQYDAACNGQTVEIGGDNGHVSLHGKCAFIRVAGNNVDLSFESAEELSVTGDGDTFRYKNKPRSIEVFGLSGPLATSP